MRIHGRATPPSSAAALAAAPSLHGTAGRGPAGPHPISTVERISEARAFITARLPRRALARPPSRSARALGRSASSSARALGRRPRIRGARLLAPIEVGAQVVEQAAQPVDERQRLLLHRAGRLLPLGLDLRLHRLDARL